MSVQSHTILGTKSQRGLTQLALDLLYQSLGDSLIHPANLTSIFPSLAGSDVSESQLLPASVFLDMIYGDGALGRGSCSRAQTPMPVNNSPFHTPTTSPSRTMPGTYPSLSQHLGAMISPHRFVVKNAIDAHSPTVFHRLTRSQAKQSLRKDASFISMPSTKNRMPRPSALPQIPSVEGLLLEADENAEYAIVLSMFEVYNDRIFDLLAGNTSIGGTKLGQTKRRALLFKSTELSPDRKVVAGLRKVVCCGLDEALMVLETGLIERRVAGTGSNATSSRSHGFFCFEVKKRNRVHKNAWSTSTLTVVDLAGAYFLSITCRNYANSSRF